MGRSKPTTPQKAALITLPQVAEGLGWTRIEVRRSRRRDWWLWVTYEHRRIKQTPLYDAQLVDVLRAFYGQVHTELAAPGADWLTKYLKGDT